MTSSGTDDDNDDSLLLLLLVVVASFVDTGGTFSEETCDGVAGGVVADVASAPTDGETDACHC